SDYYFARLRSPDLYKITGVKRLLLWVNAIKREFFSYMGMVLMYALVILIFIDLLTDYSPLSNHLMKLAIVG
ncbi:hypothetical protein ACI45T_004737, partial [Vibrio vulnificus]